MSMLSPSRDDCGIDMKDLQEVRYHFPVYSVLNVRGETLHYFIQMNSGWRLSASNKSLLSDVFYFTRPGTLTTSSAHLSSAAAVSNMYTFLFYQMLRKHL